MRANYSLWTRSLWCALVAIAATGLAASNAAAQTTVHLIAAPAVKNVTLPDGTVLAVPMWGYALDANNNNALDADEQVTVPGPRIVVPAGQASLTILLTNLLPEPTSLVIPGQPFDIGAAAPSRNGGRATSMTPETAFNGTQPYVFPGLKPGTFLYQSGSHQSVQVQMGLYGAMTKDEVDAGSGTPAQAYAGIAYAHEALLLYSEIDQALHRAVCPSISFVGVVPTCAAGTYGTPAGPTSTVDYRPSIFLINGESYTDAAASIPAGTAGETTLLRLLNAGLRTHAPVLDNGSLRIVAEDGNKLPFERDQATVLLAAGKTHDVLWTPAAEGVYSLYDRALGLNASAGTAGQGSARHAGQAEGARGGHRHDGVCERRQLQHGRGGGACRPGGGRTHQRHRDPHFGGDRRRPEPRGVLHLVVEWRLQLHARCRVLRRRLVHLHATNGTNTSMPATVRDRRTADAAGADRAGPGDRRQQQRERPGHARRHRPER